METKLIIAIIAIIVLTIILSIIIIILLFRTKTKSTNDNKLKYTDPTIILQLYQMLYDMDKIFQQSNIEYWLEGGTLLGLIRHGGIISWDDDADIQIKESDEERVYKLESSFDKLGYKLIKVWFGFKIFPINGKKIDGYEWKYPFIDIFPMKNINDKLEYKYEHAQKSFGKCYYQPNELYH